MITLGTNLTDDSVASVDFLADSLIVSFKDGRRISTPLSWYPRLMLADTFERQNYEIMPGGIHWPGLDEDLSFSGMVRGQSAYRSYSAGVRHPLPRSLTSLLQPFSAPHGIRKSQIRLQREDVLIDVAKRARAQLETEGGEAAPVPNKFFIPFLEKASLEDPASLLIEAWANLLVEASKNYDPKLSVYADILSKIGGADAEFLTKVCLSSKYEGGISWPLGHFVDNEARIRANLHLLDQSNNEDLPEDRHSYSDAQTWWSKFKSEAQLQFGYLVHASVLLRGGGAIYCYNDDIVFLDPLMVDRLEAERLVKRTVLTFSAKGSATEGSVSYVDLTYMAIDLVKICTRNFTVPFGSSYSGQRR